MIGICEVATMCSLDQRDDHQNKPLIRDIGTDALQ